tara:strand:+ start:2512 stop:2724 length:213 start_codon:yes stop_codon:yes gene_type:complete
MITQKKYIPFVLAAISIFMQTPIFIDETLKVFCVMTTKAEYIDSFESKSIPLQEKIIYCSQLPNINIANF